jgi:hypothetical protein
MGVLLLSLAADLSVVTRTLAAEAQMRGRLLAAENLLPLLKLSAG